ncbi:MAG: dihydroorotate dehydrogenase [Acidimicrobiia bacterium]|nr:dihydroorotate dehydrogenase [Acidimicrobiia bacterium]
MVATVTPAVDMSTQVGTVTLSNPVMTASGTVGHGTEVGEYVDLTALGAVVVKSLSAEPWAGNPPPRLHEVPAGMLNSVGLQNPGVEAWIEHDLPALEASGARVVASIWGFTVEGYSKAASMLSPVAERLLAVEVNLSCPNIEARRDMFAHSPAATAEVVDASAACGRPRWAKLSPNVTDITEIAASAVEAGAEALTLVNTLMGMAIDVESRRPRLGAGGGGLSGAAIRPVAVRAVYDCRRALPDAPIVGVGGVRSGEDAVELLMAGADAVQVGTATFFDPRAPLRVVQGLERWCRRHGVTHVRDLRGAAHG